jgi:nucleoside-diphosphate-sugar epimerase
MTQQHILVTGAGGYIGRHVVTALLDRGHRVTAVVSPRSHRLVDSRARVVAADLFADDFDIRTLSSEPPTGIVHLAWQDGFAHNAPSHLTMLSAHFALIHSAADWGVTRVTVLGTMHEVGYWEGAIDSSTPTNPSTLYGIAKDALRRSLFVALPSSVTLQWLRCFYIFGDDRNNHSIFTRLLEAADEGKPRFPFTSGTNKYDFIEVDELGDQIATVASQDEVSGVINCSSGVPVALGVKVEEFIASRRLDVKLEFGAYPDRGYDSPAVWGDATIIRSMMAGTAPFRA